MEIRSVRPALLIVTFAALAASGCSVLGGGPRTGPVATASTGASTGEGAAPGSPPTADQIDVRQFVGPDYCPELRILDGAQLVRRYERGHEDDPDHVVWQASFGETARECLYDGQGGLTIKVGVSGRVIAGPKGSAGDVAVPYKIAVVKFREAALASDGHTLSVNVPQTGSATFSEVREISVPSPGRSRDYIIYVGFDSGEWDLEAGTVMAAPKKKPPAPAPAPVAQPAPKPAPKQGPKVLPTPTDGFILQ